MSKVSVAIQYILTGIAFIIFLIVAVPKFIFPYESHWMEGAMLSEISWILHGQPLYLSPTIYHVPSVYQPVYYYFSAAITAVTGFSYMTVRITSLLATMATASMIFVVVRKETGKIYLGFSGIGLFIAAFGKTEFGFIAARIDPLLTAIILAATITIYYARSYPQLVMGAILFSAAFFTKQSALVFVPFISLYLVLARGWKKGLFFFFGYVSLTFITVVALNIYFEGWYTFYTFGIVRAMGGLARWGYGLHGLILYIIMRCWLITILFLFFPLRSLFKRGPIIRDRSSNYFGIFFLSGIIAGFLGIVNPGGGHNVLLQAATGCAIFLPIVVNELSGSKYAKFALWVIPVQFLFLISNPWAESGNNIRSVDKENYEKFYSYVSSLQGEVWIPYHSFTYSFTGKTEYAGFDFAQGAMLNADPRARQLHYQFDTAYANRHWNFILSDYKREFPHYRLTNTILNLNKYHGSDDSLLYIYQPE